MTQRHLSFLSCVTVLFGFSACDGGSRPSDAGTDADGLAISDLFGDCEEDWQCPGEGAICRTAAEGYPGGFCTNACDDRTPCDARSVYHHCVTLQDEDQSYCARRCLNGLDCGRTGYTCVEPDDGGICIAVCSDDEDCGAGTVCDPYTALCAAAASTAGAVTGEPCADSDGCRSGQCIGEENAGGQPTGWVGGYCVGNCVLPLGYNNSTVFDGDTLPAGGCPGDAICLPADFGHGAQFDLGRCYDQCATDTDCSREGYVCLTQLGDFSFTNGLCVPGNCDMDGCPAGYRCQAIPDGQGGTRNVCGR